LARKQVGAGGHPSSPAGRIHYAGVAITESSVHPREQPDFVRQFRAAYVDDAVGQLAGGDEVQLLLETRYGADEQVEIFTVHQGIERRAKSMNELVARLADLEQLRIPRLVPLQVDGKVTTGTITEVYRPSTTSNPFEGTVKAVLEFDSATWESPWTDFLGDALTELHGLNSHWRFRTCISCAMAGHPTPYGNDDQQLWCYRDSPEALAELAQHGRFAGGSHAFSGYYWVRAFHRCASWRQRVVAVE
jgi:hypothetical protein